MNLANVMQFEESAFICVKFNVREVLRLGILLIKQPNELRDSRFFAVSVANPVRRGNFLSAHCSYNGLPVRQVEENLTVLLFRIHDSNFSRFHSGMFLTFNYLKYLFLSFSISSAVLPMLKPLSIRLSFLSYL